MREKHLFDDSWKFHLGDFNTPFPTSKGPTYMQAKTERMKWGPASPYYDDTSDAYRINGSICTDLWENITLPHDYIIGQTPNPNNNNALGYFEYKNAWYRKKFQLSTEDSNQRITLYFEAVATHAVIYINGCLVKRNFCGYTSFEVDITDFVHFGAENTLAVYVNAEHHEGWWYEGAGIYRHVWLIKTDLTAVDLWGVYVNPKKDGEIWNVDIETTILNESIADEKIVLVSSILDQNGTVQAAGKSETVTKLKQKTVVNQTIPVQNPQLWDINAPHLYRLMTQIIKNGTVTDETETKFGFRTIQFDAKSGFSLNGTSVKIKGICAHQDYGITGKAVPDNIQKYRLALLKEMGANGFRTAHYPHSETTMDTLDELGFLVMDETRFFDSSDEGKAQLEMLVKRDRNHPSVILWSIGNEEPFHITDEGRRIADSLSALVKQLDRTRPVTTAVSIEPQNGTVYDSVDVIGVNYNLDKLDEIHKMHKKKPIVSSECCATGTTRGWYLPDSEKRGYLYGYDRDTNAWFLGREKTWKFFMEREWISGSFQWTGIEHRGETIWPRLCSQSGALDLFLQKKDAFYQNQSHWTKKPMIHLLPHWNQEGREDELIAVWAYTNCEEAELFQDTVSLGTRKIEPFGHGEWNVPYRKGRLKVIGKIGGTALAEDIVETSDGPAELRLKLENTVEKSSDVAIITCFCVDKRGRFVPDASPFVSFNINDFGKIIGTGSDVCDSVAVTSPDRKMRAGLCSVAVKLGEKQGQLNVYATTPGLKAASISIQIQ